MRSIAIGLAAAVFAAALAPCAAFAAEKAKAPTDAVSDPKKHEQGMAEAPPIAKTLNLPCTPTDALFHGQGKSKDSATGKETMSKYYELACQEGPGYIIIAPEGLTASGYDCLAMSRYKPKEGEADKGQVYCRLPANLDPVKSFQPVLAKGGVSNCTPSQGRYIGSTPDAKLDQYEIACAEGSAYVVSYPRLGTDHPFQVSDCLAAGSDTCQFFPKDKLIARLTAMAAPANRPCQVTDGRYIGTIPTSKNSFYEIACADQKSGYVLQVDASNKFVSSIDCARATSISGGCTLTTASAAQTEEITTYARLAKQIGYPCNVKAYHSFGVDEASKREVVELSCTDHPDGAIALLPVDAGQKGEYFDCVRAGLRGLKCALTPPEATYAKMTSAITASGKSCTVSNARAVGKAADGTEFVEAACSGANGVMLEYPGGADKIKTVTPCALAAGIGGGCKLGH